MNNKTLEEKISLEIERMDCYETLTIGLINDFYKNQPLSIVAPKKKKLVTMLRRMFRAEKDYLTQNPKDYFMLYSDHVK